MRPIEWTSIRSERLELLNPAQRYVVARFIVPLARFDFDQYDRDDARKALANYWQTMLDAGSPWSHA